MEDKFKEVLKDIINQSYQYGKLNVDKPDDELVDIWVNRIRIEVLGLITQSDTVDKKLDQILEVLAVIQLQTIR